MRVALVFAAGVSIAAAVYACEAYDAEVAPAADGGAGSDATIADSGGGDAINDVADAGDAATNGWVPCSARAADAAQFCDDFDDNAALGAKWTSPFLSGAASVEPTDAAATPPRAYRSRAGGNGINARAQLTLNVTAATKRFVAAFDMHIDAIGAGDGGAGVAPYAYAASIVFDDATCITNGGAKTRSVDLLLLPTPKMLGTYRGLNTCNDAGGDYVSYPIANDVGPFMQPGFKRVVIEVAKGPCVGDTGAASVRFTVNDVVTCKSTGIDPFPSTSKVVFQLGVYAGGNAPEESAVVYDDVTVDVE